MTKKKKGFTLAEVLIVLGVIGVVAALTLPTLISNIHDKVVERQIQVIQRKINQGTEGMQVRGALLENYPTTSAFIDELSKDMKIISKCDSNELLKCWPYEKVTVSPGEDKDDVEIEVKKQVDGTKAFQMGKNSQYAEVIGVIFANGTPMMLAYNKNCTLFDPDRPYETTKEGMSETSACIAGIYDINGKKGPNKLGVDVISFRANGYGEIKSCWFESGGVCFSGLVGSTLTTDSMLKSRKIEQDNEVCSSIMSTKKYVDVDNLYGTGYNQVIPINITGNTGSSCHVGGDAWLVAAIECGSTGGRLPSIRELELLADKFYVDELYDDSGTKITVKVLSIPKDMQPIFGNYSQGFRAWSNEGYDSNSSYVMSFSNSGDGPQVQNTNRADGALRMCVMD